MRWRWRSEKGGTEERDEYPQQVKETFTTQKHKLFINSAGLYLRLGRGEGDLRRRTGDGERCLRPAGDGERLFLKAEKRSLYSGSDSNKASLS